MIKCLFIVALPAEARPLINHFKLGVFGGRYGGDAYRSYANGEIALVETGLGKLNAAGATANMLGMLYQQQGSNPVCVNIGLAGAAKPVGNLLAAHSVVDQASGAKWFPQLTWAPQNSKANSSALNVSSGTEFSTIAVTTVDKPDQLYSPATAFDMEAAGIFASATKFTTLEFIQSLKVVSDNKENPIESLNKSLATELITPHCDTIERVVTQLMLLAERLPELGPSRNLAESLCKAMHFTTTQQANLRSMLQQYQTRFKELPSLDTLKSQKRARTVLGFLESSIASAPLKY